MLRNFFPLGVRLEPTNQVQSRKTNLRSEYKPIRTGFIGTLVSRTQTLTARCKARGAGEGGTVGADVGRKLEQPPSRQQVKIPSEYKI